MGKSINNRVKSIGKVSAKIVACRRNKHIVCNPNAINFRLKIIYIINLYPSLSSQTRNTLSNSKLEDIKISPTFLKAYCVNYNLHNMPIKKL